MKWRILASTLIIPLGMILALFYIVYAHGDAFAVYTAILFVILSIVRIFLVNTKYLVSSNVTATQMEIQYYGPLLQFRSINIPTSTITNLRLSEAHWIPKSAGTLNVTTEGEWFRFIILQRQQFEQLQLKIDTHRQAFG